MLRIGKWQVNISSSSAVCILYNVAAFIFLLIFRFIYPDFTGTGKLLDVFWFKARLSQGVLSYIDLFPAIFMSSAVIPFALEVYAKNAEKRFSPMFIESMKPHFICDIAGAAVYALLLIIVSPLLQSYQINIKSESRLYQIALQKAESYALDEKWKDAEDFFSVCRRIWSNDPSLDALHDKIAGGLERLRYERDPRASAVQTTRLLPGQAARLTETEALNLAKKAHAERRYYDAHWLANIAEQLARPGSIEAADAARTASLAWNAISRIENSREEAQFYAFNQRKREAYEALVSGEYLRAYYIFSELIKEAPADPDTKNFLAQSEQGLLSVAFFLDEMDLAIADVQNNAVFSIAGSGNIGRIVLQIDALTTFEDVAFGRGFQAIGFSPFNEPLWRVSGEFAKMLPIWVNEEWHTVMLLRAVDREDSSLRKEALWSGSVPNNSRGQLLLPVSFEQLLLSSAAQNGTDGFFIRDLWAAAKNLGADGFVPQLFFIKIIRIAAELAIFPSLAVFALIIGWKYRSRLRVRHAIYPMFIVMPLIFALFISLVRSLIKAIAIWEVLSYGVNTAIMITVLTSIVLFTITVFFLAAQRSDI